VWHDNAPSSTEAVQGQFMEDLLRPHVMDSALDDGYRAMAADAEREADATAWCNALAKDMADEAR